MGDTAFITNRGYGGSGGTRHYQHVTREKTQIKNPKPPKFYGNRDYFEKLIDRDRNPPLKRNAKRDYYEFMVYAQDEKQIEAIRTVIAKRLKIDHRRVLAVYHEDEGTPHTHFLIAWRDPKGRALRMKIGDINYIRYASAKIIGRELPKERKRKEETKGVKYKWVDEKLCKAISEMEERLKERQKEFVRQIAKVVHLYGAIDVFLLRREVGRIRCCTLFEHNRDLIVAVYNPKTQEFERFDVFKHSVLRYANLRKHNEITFAPSRVFIKYGAGEIHHARAVAFVDDVPPHMLDKLPKNTLVVQTSPDKYQAHIPIPLKPPCYCGLEFWDSPVLDNKYHPEDRKYGNVKIEELQHAIASYFEGDVGSRDYYHLRKLPGYLNVKYEDAPAVEMVREPSQEQDREFLNMIAEYVEAQKEFREKYLQIDRKNAVEQGRTKLLTWDYFYEKYKRRTLEGERVDLSRVDMAYTDYLIAHSVDTVTVGNLLKSESKDLAIRKRGHLEDYLSRTISKAIEFVQRMALDKAPEEVKEIEIHNHVKEMERGEDNQPQIEL